MYIYVDYIFFYFENTIFIGKKLSNLESYPTYPTHRHVIMNFQLHKFNNVIGRLKKCDFSLNTKCAVMF